MPLHAEHEAAVGQLDRLGEAVEHRVPGHDEPLADGRLGTGAVLVQRAYLDLVEGAFAQLGDVALRDYRASTEPPPFPVAELARIDLPG